MGREGNPDKADTNASDFMWYDRYIQQTVPFIVNAQFSGGISETQLVCVAPNEVVEGVECLHRYLQRVSIDGILAG